MRSRIFSILILCMYVSISFAQEELNPYKYVIVPKKYDFLKEEDKFQLNSLTKFLFEKKGFNTIFEDQTYPSDLAANPCLGVTVYVLDDSSLFTTKFNIQLKDCYNKVVYTSEDGKSKEKEYKKAYQEALRKSFVSIEALEYSYTPSAMVTVPQVSATPAKVEIPTVAVAVVPAVAEIPANSSATNEVLVKEQSPVEKSILKSYKNESISFFLMEQNQNFNVIVNQSNSAVYQKGEQIGTLTKTSLPNVYKATWRNQEGKKEETTAYFDADGNLNVDMNREGKIEVVVFQLEN